MVTMLEEWQARGTPSLGEYRALIEWLPVMVWRTNEVDECDYCNDTWTDFLGTEAGEPIGHGRLDHIHEDDRYRYLSAYLRAVRRREPFTVEYRLRRRDGAYRWVLDVGRPMPDAKGDFAGYIGTCTDITERVEAIETERKRLRGLLPICAGCKSIRDDQGYWHSVEAYVSEHSEADFSHGICPDCMKRLYPGYLDAQEAVRAGARVRGRPSPARTPSPISRGEGSAALTPRRLPR